MNQNDRYRWFRVYYIGSKNPKIEKYKNPGEAIRNCSLLPVKIRFKF